MSSFFAFYLVSRNREDRQVPGLTIISTYDDFLEFGNSINKLYVRLIFSIILNNCTVPNKVAQGIKVLIYK